MRAHASHGKPIARARRNSAPTRRTAQGSGAHVALPGGREVTLTRRHFLYGAAGIAALALLGGTAYATGTSKDKSSLATLRVPEEAVLSSNDLEQIEDSSTVMEAVVTAELPYGTLLWSSDEAIAACLLPTETAKPLTQIGLFHTDSGTYDTVVEMPVGEEEGFQIYDVRANSAGVIWTEADIMDGLWRVYAAPLSEGTLGEPRLVDEGDGNWEMPTLACAATYGYWQCLPQLSGNARVQDSLLKRVAFAGGEAEVVYASQGRMACPPTSCGDAIIATPRARVSGTYYQLTRIDGVTGAVTDACVLPSSMRPMECGWGKTGFNFAFDGIYNYGEGIHNLGTYMPLALPEVSIGAAGDDATGTDGAASNNGASEQAAGDNGYNESSTDGEGAADGGDAGSGRYLTAEQTVAPTEAYSDEQWFHYVRNPLFAPTWCGDWVIMRGQRGAAAIDLANARYTSLPLENGSTNGEFIASTGMGQRAITYSDIDYTSLEGKQRKCCLVRVWQPVQEESQE